MSDRTDALDAAKRRIDALWDPAGPGTRGRPAKVTRAEVVDAAIALARSGGLTAVSMRSVARALGVGAMTLYTHVGSQAELVDAMVDRAYADFEPAPAGTGWREALEQHARGLWRLYRRHAWLADVNAWRLPLGPHVFDVEEAGYRSLVDSGLAASEVVEVLSVVQNFVVGYARSVAAEEAEARDQGVDYDAHWRSTSYFWENHFDPARYPTMTRLWSVGAFETAPGPLDVPLGTLLDTVGLLIDRARTAAPPPIPAFTECMDRYDENLAQQKEDLADPNP
ncbi:TetR/AcrR family transcriptional regulator [Gordonia caeni]|uniref:TetR/AcrR family transcriptional regulator C-terminal domain-containing protein n=1 Tax=Gordonia caeni TaxID=1007097 RepID=A0ABP7PAJ1_9ACTN